MPTILTPSIEHLLRSCTVVDEANGKDVPPSSSWSVVDRRVVQTFALAHAREIALHLQIHADLPAKDALSRQWTRDEMPRGKRRIANLSQCDGRLRATALRGRLLPSPYSP